MKFTIYMVETLADVKRMRSVGLLLYKPPVEEMWVPDAGFESSDSMDQEAFDEGRLGFLWLDGPATVEDILAHALLSAEQSEDD